MRSHSKRGQSYRKGPGGITADGERRYRVKDPRRGMIRKMIGDATRARIQMERIELEAVSKKNGVNLLSGRLEEKEARRLLAKVPSVEMIVGQAHRALMEHAKAQREKADG